MLFFICNMIIFLFILSKNKNNKFLIAMGGFLFLLLTIMKPMINNGDFFRGGY